MPWKDFKPVTSDLKRIYQSTTEDEALLTLDEFADRWDEKYPQISRSWRAYWQNLNTLFGYSEDIRRVIYTTNAIGSLNSVIRKAGSQKAETVSHRRLGDAGDLPGDPRSLPKMDDADPQLETGHESFYDRVLRPLGGLHLTLAVSQKYLQGPDRKRHN